MALLMLFGVLSCLAATVPLTSNQKVFGHSIKNGPLPAKTELTTFSHTCGSPPCAITMIHVPSIYPAHGEAWDWEHGRISIYADDDGSTPSVVMTLSEMVNLGSKGAVGREHQDGSPFGTALQGKTAASGGVYSTVRIPFTKTIRTTIQSAPNSTSKSVFWMIIRGMEAYPVILGDLQLPAAARLRLHRIDAMTVQPQQLVTLANISAGTSGAVLSVVLDAASTDKNYLEACMRFYPSASSDTPIFLSSGAEDYFLSASYFDEGMFKTPLSGLTYLNQGSLTAYRMHERDPVVWGAEGMKLVFRNYETTSGCGDTDHCPNQFCVNGTAVYPTASEDPKKSIRAPETAPAVYSTLVWTYEWPSSAEVQSDDSSRWVHAVRRLSKNGLLTSDQEAMVIDSVLDGASSVRQLLDSIGGLTDNDLRSMASHVLRRAKQTQQ